MKAPSQHLFTIGWWEYRITSHGFSKDDIVDVHVRDAGGMRWERVSEPMMREAVIRDWLSSHRTRKKASD